MTSVSMISVTDPSSVNTESAGVEDAESSQGGEPAQPEPGKESTAEEEALLVCTQRTQFSSEMPPVSWPTRCPPPRCPAPVPRERDPSQAFCGTPAGAVCGPKLGADQPGLRVGCTAHRWTPLGLRRRPRNFLGRGDAKGGAVLAVESVRWLSPRRQPTYTFPGRNGRP